MKQIAPSTFCQRSFFISFIKSIPAKFLLSDFYYKKSPRQNNILCQGRINSQQTMHLLIRGATLIYSHYDCTLSRISSYPRQLTYAFTSQNTLHCISVHLTVPSAVHLIICFSPDSQQHGLSVEA